LKIIITIFLILNINLFAKINEKKELITKILSASQIVNMEIKNDNRILSSFLKKKINSPKKKFTQKENMKILSLMNKYKIKVLSKKIINMKVKPINLRTILSNSLVETNNYTNKKMINNNNLFKIMTKSNKNYFILSKKYKYNYKKFKTITDNIRSYSLILNTSKYMEDYRIKRSKTQNINKIIKSFKNYSMEGKFYVKKLNKALSNIDKIYF